MILPDPTIVDGDEDTTGAGRRCVPPNGIDQEVMIWETVILDNRLLLGRTGTDFEALLHQRSVLFVFSERAPGHSVFL